MTFDKAGELARLRNEVEWPAHFIHVKTWPDIEPRRFGILAKGELAVMVVGGTVEKFDSYEKLVEVWMGD